MLCYMQVLLGLPCNAKADIYSMGVLLWELATSLVPQGRDLRFISCALAGPVHACAALLSTALSCHACLASTLRSDRVVSAKLFDLTIWYSDLT